jgi:hypothetical protein
VESGSCRNDSTDRGHVGHSGFMERHRAAPTAHSPADQVAQGRRRTSAPQFVTATNAQLWSEVQWILRIAERSACCLSIDFSLCSQRGRVTGNQTAALARSIDFAFSLR